MLRAHRYIPIKPALCAAFLVAASAPAAQCYPSGLLPLSPVVGRSEVVIVGRIERVEDGVPCLRTRYGSGGWSSPQSLLAHRCSVRAELVVKGPGVGPADTVEFQYLAVDPQRPALLKLPRYEVGERWLLFLQRADGHLEPVNPRGEQDLKIPPDIRLQQPRHWVPLERAEHVLTQLLRSRQTPLVHEVLARVSGGTQMAALPVDDPPLHESISTRIQWCFATTGLLAAIQNLIDSEHAAIKARAAATLVRVGSVDAIDQLVAVARARPEQQDGGGPPVRLDALHAVVDPRAVPRLHALLTDSDPVFHEPAAYALRQIADPRSVPFLVQALDDPDFHVRYLSATALAEIQTDHDRFRSMDGFREREGELIAYWKRWYSERSHSPSLEPPS